MSYLSTKALRYTLLTPLFCFDPGEPMKSPKTPIPPGRTSSPVAKTKPHAKAAPSGGTVRADSHAGSPGFGVPGRGHYKPFPLFPLPDDVEQTKTALVFVPVTKFPGGAGFKKILAGHETAPGTSSLAFRWPPNAASQFKPTAGLYFTIDTTGAVTSSEQPFASITLSSRQEVAARAALGRLPELMRALDQERVDDIIKASIAAAVPLQRGARGQAELLANRISEVLSTVPMLTAAEVGRNAATTSDKPDALAAQWATRGQVFALELAGHGIRYPAFQFQPDSGKPWPALAKVLPTLKAAFSPVDLLIWFESPHPAIGQRLPVSVLHDAQLLQRIVDESLAPVDVW